MALINIIERSRLATIAVLAPERYDPRRKLDTGTTKTVLLGDIISLVRRVVQPSTELGPCLVLDTSDAREGIVISRKQQVDGTNIGSAKKVIESQDVIISRLRPYLRQVAYVDNEIPNFSNALIVCSTEFFVLRSLDKRSVAFLMPFLLSTQVQQVLAASQEGGHHPRFDDSTLLTLPIPLSLLSKRGKTSRAIEEAIKQYRQSERTVKEMVSVVESSF